MLIAWLEPPSIATQGDQVHRTLWPAQTLAAQGPEHLIVGSHLSPTMRLAAEISDGLILCQAFDADFLQLIARRRARGAWTLVEINDHIYNDHVVGEAGAFYQNPETQALVEQLALLADGLWCSSETLRAQHASPHQPSATLVNAAPDVLPARPMRASTAPFRLGWAGSAGHIEDIRSLVPTLAGWLRARPQVTLDIMTPRSAWPALTELPRGQVTIVRDAPFPDYLRFLSRLDVSLAPLLDTPFNRARSDVKYLEAAAMGAVFVGQQGPAYAASVCDGVNGRTFADATSLPAILDALAASPRDCAALASAARQHVHASRSLQSLAEARRAFWRTLPASQGLRHASQKTEDRWQRLVDQARQEVGPALELQTRYCRLPVAGAAAHLFAGLVQGRSGKEALQEARCTQPTFFLPALAEAIATPHAAEAHALMRQAHHWAPDSDVVALARIRLCLQHQDMTLANQLTEQAIARGTLHGPLWEHHARLLLQANKQQEGETALRQAIAHTPHLQSAREALCQCLCLPSLQRIQRRDEAVAVAEAGCRLRPQDITARLRVARVVRAYMDWPLVLKHASTAWKLASKQGVSCREGHALSAEAHVRLGRTAEARRHLALAQGLPENTCHL